MTYVSAQARQELLDALAEAVDSIAEALASLTAAYELLDEGTADRLEAELFRPAQTAYGRAKRTHAGFAERFGLAGRAFSAAPAQTASRSVHELLDDAVDAVSEADDDLGTLQDSMMPVEVGDAELRAGLSEVRRLIGDLPARAHEIARIVGR
ncbi:MAG: hypothetical protein LT070_14080 [Solirubrobacteraceae bacterium]|nr:hypothetical protein [Solirubrobacteraceae bacterium]